MTIFRDLKTAGCRRYLPFLNNKFSNFERSDGSKMSKCVSVLNFVAIGRTVAEIWQFFDFSKMAAIHHLGFVMYVFGPPKKGIWWSLSLCSLKFRWI